MRLPWFKAAICAAVVGLSFASSASAGWPGYYGWGGYGGYWPYSGYYYSYAPYWGSYYYPYRYYPYSYSYYPSYYSGYYAYTPAYNTTPTTVVTAPSTSTYQSFYPSDSAMKVPTGDEAIVRIHTSPDAQVWFDGAATSLTGAVRTFETPELKPARSFVYDVKVRWMQNGQPVERTRSITVAAGETLDVDLTPSRLMR
jgi:uncharacterized protein (TIGR03000 family)